MCLTNNKFVWCFILITAFVTITICADTAICTSHFKNNTEKLISKNDSDALNEYWPQLVKEVEISKQLKVSPDLEEIKNDLLLALKSAFPKNTIGIDLFGSRMTGVGNENSDIDIHVQLGEINNYY
ncbi:uncharacterized protein LOC132785152 [Drosophila nasuta]|uniref:uncharacterized protein LOC132785152 n=1 Tax=Drosophila nasuta TaxID=42062 RepID=UPI00295F1C06|nr:uncharacterized protein LOC132785152 [Drosophila nasuta]